METINNIELRDANIYPDEIVLNKILGQSYPVYINLLELFHKHQFIYEWNYYNDGKAWLCKVQKKKKTIAWMSAWKDFMQVTIYIPLTLLEKVLALEIDERVKDKIIHTKNVGRSKPCIFEIRTSEILIDLEKVIEFKITSK